MDKWIKISTKEDLKKLGKFEDLKKEILIDLNLVNIIGFRGFDQMYQFITKLQKLIERGSVETQMLNNVCDKKAEFNALRLNVLETLELKGIINFQRKVDIPIFIMRIQNFMQQQNTNTIVDVQAKAEAKAEVMEAVKAEVKAEVMEAAKAEAKAEVMEFAMAEVMEEAKAEIMLQAKAEVMELAKAEVMETAKAEAKAEVMEAVKAEVKAEAMEVTKAEVMEEVREEIKAEIMEEVREEIKAEVMKEVREEIKAKAMTEVRVEKQAIDLGESDNRGFFKSEIHEIAYKLINYNSIFDASLGITRLHYLSAEKAKEWRNKYAKMFHPDQKQNMDMLEETTSAINKIYNRMVGKS